MYQGIFPKIDYLEHRTVSTGVYMCMCMCAVSVCICGVCVCVCICGVCVCICVVCAVGGWVGCIGLKF